VIAESSNAVRRKDPVEIRGKLLDDIKVARFRRRFEKDMTRYRDLRKTALQFDELLDLFANDCLTFAEIGRRLGEEALSRERVRQIYNKYFRGFFPRRRGGRLRRRVCALRRRHIAAKDFAGNEALAKIYRLAGKAGVAVEKAFIAGSRQPRFRRKGALIGGALYVIHHAKILFHQRRRSYARALLRVSTLHRAAGVIVLQETGSGERVFIFPSRDILETYSREIEARGEICLFIPTEKLPVYRNRKPRLDWWKYENAWPGIKAQG
jgi:hypothetical protein